MAVLPLDTIIHGDCLSVIKSFPDESIDAIVTDPPYGIDYQSAWRTDKTQRKPKIANDKRPFIWWLYDAYRVTKQGGTLVCFCEWRYQEVFRMAIEVAGYTVRSQVVWDRAWHGLGDLNSTFAPQHDIIWFASKGRFVFSHGRPKSVIRSQRIAAQHLMHPNEKPLDLMQQLVKAVTPDNGTVMDCFSGSGSTLLAAKQEGMHYIGIERDEQYVEVARKRLVTIWDEATA